MTQAKGKRRGQGEDSIYWDSSKNRYGGAVSLGFSPADTRIRRKVTGRTKPRSVTASESCTSPHGSPEYAHQA